MVSNIGQLQYISAEIWRYLIRY